MPSPFQLHIAKWSKGCGAPICEGATRVCFARGAIPCDWFFCGEAPGHGEDANGQPFIGPAGHLIDKIIKAALPGKMHERDDGFTEHWVCDLRICFGNLVGCIPLGEDGKKTDEPDALDIKQCRPRLKELIRMCQPKMIVCVGALARKHMMSPSEIRLDGKPENPEWIPDNKYLLYGEMIHPAAILRAVPAQQSLMRQRAVVQLQGAYLDYQRMYHAS